MAGHVRISHYLVPSGIFALWVTAICASVAGQLLFIRMAVEVNRKLPFDKRIPLFGLKEHIWEVRSLHGDMYPKSAVRTAAYLLIGCSTFFFVVAVILAVEPR